MTQKSTPRVEKMREALKALGIRRRDVYVHDDDWPGVRQYTQEMQRRRMEAAVRKADARRKAET